MKSHIDVSAQRILLLIKLDATALFSRVKERKVEYLGVFAIKRTRKHFEDIFFNRYCEVGIRELLHCPEECIVAIDHFYNTVEKIQWYLNCTEDMPATVEDRINRKVKELEVLFNTLCLYIDAELSPQPEERPFADDSAQVDFSTEDTDLFVQD